MYYVYTFFGTLCISQDKIAATGTSNYHKYLQSVEQKFVFIFCISYHSEDDAMKLTDREDYFCICTVILRQNIMRFKQLV